MRNALVVDNIHCGGCANAIKAQLGAMPGVSQVEVDIPGGTVLFEAAPPLLGAVEEKLRALGYPRRGAASPAAHPG